MSARQCSKAGPLSLTSRSLAVFSLDKRALLEVLMRRHNERLYRTVRAILKDEREAEDIMQQAYVKAYSHLRQFDGRAVFLTWLTQIAIHEALVRARRRNRYTNMDDENRYHLRLVTAMDSTRDPARLAFARELGALTEWAIDRLPDGSRQVSILRQVEGMSTQAVADALNVSEAVVKTRLSAPAQRCAVSYTTRPSAPRRTRFASRDRDAIAWWRRSSPASCESTAADRRARPSRSRTEDN